MCCRCNGKGRCRNCRCVRNGLACVNCLPLRRGRCENITLESIEVSDLSSSDSSSDSDSEDEQGFRTPEILQEDEIVPEPTDEGISITLPTFVQIEKSQFLWGDCDGETFMSLLNRTYDEVVHRRKNVFRLPSGKFGKMFVSELSRLFNAYYPGSCLEGVTLKAAMTLPILVLQKPFATSKTCDHVQCLERRLKLWQKGDLEALLEEGHSIQHRLSSSHSNRRVNSTSLTFSKLMLGQGSCCITIIEQPGM